MPDRPTIKPATISSLIASGGSTEEIIEAAYELGVSHGMRFKTEAAKESAALRAKREQDRRTARAISGIPLFKSEIERLWWTTLCSVFKTVEYEPKTLPCVVKGYKTSYTPDFRVTTEDGEVFWIEVKADGWPFFSKKYQFRRSVLRQASAIQACVRAHRLHLFVVSG